jgi:hypothetical protein
MPRCTCAVINAAGHDIYLDQPEAFVLELKQFLQYIQVTEQQFISNDPPGMICPA